MATLKNKVLLFLILINVVSAFSQVKQVATNQLVSGIENLSEIPTTIRFQNRFGINNQGGHLQGIQYLQYNQNTYYVLSGSSEEYAYYSIVKSGKENVVISLNKLMEKPFKHAGGFQIYENLMAIGVEDNDAKNRSKVFVFNLNNPEKPPEKPLVTIDRIGPAKRATAGCVGITTLKDKVLIVVGDWDTEHLDFYRIDREKMGLDSVTPELIYSIDISKINKTGWTDEKWLAYQNINLIQDNKGQLFLAGMSSDENKENVLDLYKIETNDLLSFKLIKIHTQRFKPNEQTSFIWGAGIYSKDGLLIKLVSCSAHIEENSVIHVYE